MKRKKPFMSFWIVLIYLVCFVLIKSYGKDDTSIQMLAMYNHGGVETFTFHSLNFKFSQNNTWLGLGKDQLLA